MSRTDVHRPGWVKERDHYMRRWMVEEHDHSEGPCDLEVWRANPHLPWLAVNCRMVYAGHRNIYCGCRRCTGHDGLRYQHRQERAAWRADARSLLKGGEERPPRRFESWF